MIVLFLVLFNFNAHSLDRTNRLPTPWDQQQALFDKLSPQMIDAGAELFFDPILSRNRKVSCASCHLPEFAFSNGQAKAQGVYGAETEYNVPVLFNRIGSKIQFWDGRVHSLREQIFHPILNVKEMDMSERDVVERLNGSAKYKAMFGTSITRALVEEAFTSFISSLVSGNSKYDRFAAGDTTALSAEEIAGKSLFFERYKCDRCHSGPNFTNESMARRCGSSESQYAVPYKVPTLRNLGASAPYLHNGHLKTLSEVLDFYDQGSNEHGFAIKMEDKKKIALFLESLNAPVVSYRPQSTLPE